MSVAVQAVHQVTDELVEAAGHLLAQLSSATGRNQDPPVKPAVHIRACQQEDAKQLKRQGRAQPQRWQRHQQGNSTFLIAVSVRDDVPVGMGEILWDGCEAPEVRQRYPSCPELNGLEVWPAELRSHGIGTAIVHTAEDLARQRGHHQLGLGVDDHNHRAAALYLRLGYQETGCHYLDRYHYIDHDGVRHEVADPARFLVKPLSEGYTLLPAVPSACPSRGHLTVSYGQQQSVAGEPASSCATADPCVARGSSLSRVVVC